MKITFEAGPRGTVLKAASADGRYSYFCGRPNHLRDDLLKRDIYNGYSIPDVDDRTGAPPLASDSDMADVGAFWDALRAHEKRAQAEWEAAHEAAFLAEEERRDARKQYPGGGSEIFRGLRGYEEGEEGC